MPKQSVLSNFAKVLRARAKHQHGLKIGLKAKGNLFTLTLKEGNLSRSQTFEIDERELLEIAHDWDLMNEQADTLISRVAVSFIPNPVNQ